MRTRRSVSLIAPAFLALLTSCGGEKSPLGPPPVVLTPAKLAIKTQPSSASAGTALGEIKVEVQDASGAVVTTSAAEVSIALGTAPPGAALSGTVSVQAKDGVATFTNLSIAKSGSGYTLVASATGLASATTSSFDIAPAGVSRVAFTTQPSSIVAGAEFASPVQVTVYDSYDNVATNSVLPVIISSAPGTPALFGTTSVVPTSGVATFTGLSLRSSGAGFQMRATSNSLTPTTSASFNVSPGPPAKLVFDVPPTSPTESMEPLGALRVAVKDFYDNRVASTGIAIDLQFASNPLGASLIGTTSANTVNGVAAFDNVAIDMPGASYDIIARASGTTIADAVAAGVAIKLSAIAITAGRAHSCVINTAHRAYCWGDNSAGQLGDNSTTERLRPTLVAGGLTFLEIHAGASHTCGLVVGRAAYCWGSNAFGQLGDGTTTERRAPVPVIGGHLFRSLATGGDHTCAIGPVLETSTLRCWGRNTHGQVGDNSTTDRTAPVLIAGVAPRQVSADSLHTCSVNWSDFRSFCWGDNTFGQLGDGTKTRRLLPRATAGVTAFFYIAVGAKHSCGATNDDFWCWGSNADGQLGSGSIGGADVTSPFLTGLAGEPMVAGGHNVCAFSMCWGRNDEGELGDNSTTDRGVPTEVYLGGDMQYPPGPLAVGARHTCTIMSAFLTLYCWGQNDRGQLGDATKTSSIVPVRVIQ